MTGTFLLKETFLIISHSICLSFPEFPSPYDLAYLTNYLAFQVAVYLSRASGCVFICQRIFSRKVEK